MQLKKIPPSGRDRSGFRLRGQNVSRLENFCDVVFGFSLTMVIVSDQKAEDFNGSLWRIPAFFICFCTLFLLWYLQQNFFRRFGLADFFTSMLTGLMLFTVMVLVFPLRYIVYLSVEAFQGHRTDKTGTEYFLAITYYMLCMALITLCAATLHMHVLRNGEEIELEESEATHVKLTIAKNLISVVVLTLSAIGVIVLHRGPQLMWLWGTLFVAMPIARKIAARVYRAKHKVAPATEDSAEVDLSATSKPA